MGHIYTDYLLERSMRLGDIWKYKWVGELNPWLVGTLRIYIKYFTDYQNSKHDMN